MKKIEQSGRVNDDGILSIHYRKILDALLFNHFRNSDVDITITKKRKTRSTQQNRYYRGVIVPAIQQGLYETQGEWLTKMEVHEFLKLTFNYKELVNMNTGEMIKQLRDAQKKYFIYRKNGNVNTLEQLELCKKLEKELDKTVEEILKTKENKNQQSLFNN